MFVLIAIILGILIGFIRGGSFGGFKVKKISLLPLGIIGIVLQFALHLYYYTGGIGAIDAFLPVVNFISYILILVMLVFNLDDFWTIMVSVGLTANFIVTFINGGKMPVAAQIVESLPQTSAFAISINEGTNAIYAIMQQSGLWVLGVNVPIPIVGGLMRYFGSIGGFSIGSAVVFIGIIGWVQYAMKRQKSAFSKDEPIGELDYILPPDTDDEDDDDDFFSDYDDDDNDYYPEEDFSEDTIENLEESFEGVNGSLTDVIPKLTPEAIAAMQNNDAGLGRSILEEYDSSQDTKVFTTIRDIGSHEPTDLDDKNIHDVDDTGPVSGFFTQSFYAEKEKGKLAFEQEKTTTLEKPEERIPEERVIIKEPEAIVVEAPPIPFEPVTPVQEVKAQPVPASIQAEPEVMERTPFVVENDKIVSNPEYEKPMINNKEERSEAEMMSVWQQLNQEQEKVRARKRRRTSYINVKEPFKAEREKVAAEKAVARAQAVAKAQALSETQPVYRQVTSETEVVVQQVPDTLVQAEPVQPTSAPTTTFITPPIAPIQEPVTKTAQTAGEVSAATGAISDEEREKAGYERVKLEVEGREVVFWRKKKD